MLGFGVFADARSKEIRVLILRGTYSKQKFELGKFYFTIICSILNYLSNAINFTLI